MELLSRATSAGMLALAARSGVVLAWSSNPGADGRIRVLRKEK
jgi:hypothetical protein